ncbi:hypothetical protein N9C83_02830 [Opitutales bacterium]|nr:hypothetical protein [Opitutales bacterium]
MYLRIVCIWIALACACTGQSDQAKTLYEKGVNENKSGNLLEASVSFTAALAAHPRYVDAYYQRGMSYYGINNLDAAISDLDQATLLKVKSINAYLILIDLYNDQNAYPKALVISDRIKKSLPSFEVEAYYTKGLIYEEMSDFYKALTAYRTADRLAYKLRPGLMKELQKRTAEVLIKIKMEERGR